MVVLISVQSSAGHEGQCDARCYEATGGHCSCICGGINHGAGEQQAVANTRALAESMVAHFAEERGIGPATCDVFLHPWLAWVQLSLPF